MSDKKPIHQRNHRIYIEKKHHSVYKLLTDGEESIPIFDSMKNVFMLAIFIGYQQDKRIPLTNKVDIFSWDVLSNDEESKSLVYALALAEEGDIEILTDKGKILDIAEEYANAGIIEIKEKIADMDDNKIKHLVSLIGSYMPDEIISKMSDLS